MHTNILNLLMQTKKNSQCLYEKIEKKEIDRENVIELIKYIDVINKNIPDFIIDKYAEIFYSFTTLCVNCIKDNFTKENAEILQSSLEIIFGCIEKIEQEYLNRIKKCVCCGKEVIYHPLSKEYRQMFYRFGNDENRKFETLNMEEYMCPTCGSSDRDRFIISFLEKSGLQKAKEGFKVLQFAPTKVITDWIVKHCPHVDYETTDLFMSGVSYKADIQNMTMVEDDTYDLVICSHVLEHVEEDKKALQELKRILKPEGKIVFLVPIDLKSVEIDEEWGLTEEQNWERFGQGDHCRLYSKNGLQKRLKEQFHVWELDKNYFSKEVYFQCGLTDTSILYILTKSESVSLELAEEIVIDQKLCQEGPLVSVILPCYNHEEYVEDSIKSILGQSYKNIEIIVADDCSTDHTVDVLRRYSQYFDKEVYLKKNTGAAIAHELLKYAKGKYVALAHSDDLWDKDKLAMQVEYMEKHPECGVCFTWCRTVDDNLKEMGGSIFIQKNRTQHEWMRDFWENGNALCNPSSLTRTEIALEDPKYGYNLWRQLPDFFKWVDRIQRYPIYIIPKVLTKMRWHPFGANENTSTATQNNLRRGMVEEGSSWLGVIRNMSDDFFKKSFYELMINPNAQTEVEIKCEKYFLLLNHYNVFVQNTAFIYLCEVYAEIEECLEFQYDYSRSNLATDMTQKGILGLIK